MVRCWFSKSLLWNYPAWSIHCEWFAYLFPVAFFAFRNASRAWILLSAIVALLVAHCLLPIKTLPGCCGEIVFLFLAGSGLYRLRVLLNGIAGHWAANFGLVLLLGALFYRPENALARVAIHSAFVLLIFGLSYERGICARVLSCRWVVYGGAVSYSIYMMHAVVLRIFGAGRHSLFPEWTGGPTFGTLVFAIALSLLAASLMYHFVEVPCNKALRKRWAACGAKA